MVALNIWEPDPQKSSIRMFLVIECPVFGFPLYNVVKVKNYFENICCDVVEDGDNVETDLIVQFGVVQNFPEQIVNLVKR